MLTNPLYAGRIRHKHLVHDGLHPAIVDPVLWNDIQARLVAHAARIRGGETRGEASAFIGKIFDETGDRLTPSHAVKKGVRHRYYISRRLVQRSGIADPSGWRLPAHPLEKAIASAIAAILREPGFPSRLIGNASAAEISTARQRLLAKAESLACGDRNSASAASDLVARVDLACEQITTTLDHGAMASALGVPKDRIQLDALIQAHPLRLRRRGKETRLTIGAPEPEIDAALLRNLAGARKWLSEVRAGRSLEEIAAAEGITRSRITQVIPLAFLAPDIVASIAIGTQPSGLTMNWLMAHELPSCWKEQRRILAEL